MSTITIGPAQGGAATGGALPGGSLLPIPSSPKKMRWSVGAFLVVGLLLVAAAAVAAWGEEEKLLSLSAFHLGDEGVALLREGPCATTAATVCELFPKGESRYIVSHRGSAFLGLRLRGVLTVVDAACYADEA
jgi:hypothetical protein